jgi:hypothetical protein
LYFLFITFSIVSSVGSLTVLSAEASALSKIMELRLKHWLPIFEEQAKSGLNKKYWCRQNDVKRAAFFKWQRELRKYLLERNENSTQDQFSSELTLQAAPDFVELAPVSTSPRL